MRLSGFIVLFAGEMIKKKTAKLTKKKKTNAISIKVIFRYVNIYRTWFSLVGRLIKVFQSSLWSSKWFCICFSFSIAVRNDSFWRKKKIETTYYENMKMWRVPMRENFIAATQRRICSWRHTETNWEQLDSSDDLFSPVRRRYQLSVIFEGSE